MLKGIPPHEQLITHYRIPLHVACRDCANDLFGSATEYVEYAGVGCWNWPEAWCPNCGLPQYVDLGELTRYLGEKPVYDPAESLIRLKRLVLLGVIRPEQLVTHNSCQVHAPCEKCGEDLFGSPAEYYQYAGRAVNWPEVWCQRCGCPQYAEAGQCTQHLGNRPGYDRAAFVNRLRTLVSHGPLSPEHIITHTHLQYHAPCCGCGYDLFGLCTEYRQYAGIIIDPPQVRCSECGIMQHVDAGGAVWRLNPVIVKEVLSGLRTI